MTTSVPDLPAPRVPTALRRRAARAAAIAIAALGLGCTSTGTLSSLGPGGAGQDWKSYQLTLPVSHPPFDQVHSSWRDRIDDAYVYVDCYGHYGKTGTHIPMLIREAQAQGLRISGPPFCLFYDDPAVVEEDQLRSRACVPIQGPATPKGPLSYDVIESRTIVYAYTSGAYPNVPRAYPRMFEFMRSLRFEVDGPIREIYIVPPAEATAPSDLLCEVQIPVRMAN